jgi:hypothetical protein
MLGRFFLVLTVSAAIGAARAGHETPIYPSYYPQEIRIEPVDPATAAAALLEGRIHAYVGAEPAFAAETGDSIAFVESLGAFLVVDVNPDSAVAGDRQSRCAVARTVVAGLAAAAEFQFHPYPVNPFHADYLHHFDLATAAKARVREPSGAAAADLRVRAEGARAERLVRARWPAAATDWDARVVEVDAGRLVSGRGTDAAGWTGTPWLKQGWYHAYLLLADWLPDTAAKARAAALLARLQRGGQKQVERKINLERELVTLLTGSCRRSVAGYRVQREYYSTEYSGGVENIAYDSHAGFNSAIFIRTVKLKDFPWNGWLTLGIGSRPTAAWNPVAGFTDDAGRLIWRALGDPALFPEPYNAGWNPNRIGDVKATAGR